MVREENTIETEKTTEPVNENSEEKDTEKVETGAAPNDIPLGAILDIYTEKIRDAVFTIMYQNGIPASLMDYMLCMVLSETRELKVKEYAIQISGKE